MTQRLAGLFIVLACCLVICGDILGQAGKVAISPRETALFVAEGTAKGMALQAVAAVQHAKALALWQRLFSETDPPHFESNRFLVYGTSPGRTPKEIAANLEKQYALAVKALEMEQDEPWAGKLAVYCMPNRDGFLGLIRVLEQRRLDEGEQGTYGIDEDYPYVAASPPATKDGMPTDLAAGGQMAAALMVKKGGRNVPDWIQLAFGRATAYRGAPLKEAAAERRKAALLLIKYKRTLKDLVPPTTGVTDDDLAVLQGSVLDYLAYSGRTSKFQPLVGGFRQFDENKTPNFNDGLMAANLTIDRLDQVWQAWLRSNK